MGRKAHYQRAPDRLQRGLMGTCCRAGFCHRRKYLAGTEGGTGGLSPSQGRTVACRERCRRTHLVDAASCPACPSVHSVWVPAAMELPDEVQRRRCWRRAGVTGSSRCGTCLTTGRLSSTLNSQGVTKTVSCPWGFRKQSCGAEFACVRMRDRMATACERCRLRGPSRAPQHSNLS